MYLCVSRVLCMLSVCMCVVKIPPAKTNMLMWQQRDLTQNEICDRPPGGACTRVDGRSVMTLPQFWFEPLENLFDETPRLAAAALGAALAAGMLVLVLAFIGSGPPKLIDVWPPAGA